MTSTTAEVYSLAPAHVAGNYEPPTFKLPLLNGIPSRGITYDTCNLYRTYASLTPLEIYHEYHTLDGESCGTKFRKGGWSLGKKEVRWAPGSTRSLFGCHLYEGEKLDVYVFEGETDAMAMSQRVDGLCVAYGGSPAPALLAKWQAWIADASEGHEVHLCFDNDTEGQAYQDAYLKSWAGPRVQVLRLPEGVKDAAQLLLEGGEPTFEPLIYALPECLLTGDQLKLQAPVINHNLSTGYSDLDHYIGGYSPGKIIVLAGPSKHGKSSFVCNLTVNYLRMHPGKVLYIPLELNVDETMRFLGAAHAGVHSLDITAEALEESQAQLRDKLYMVKHFGQIDIPLLTELLDCIPHVGIELVVLDHITSAATSFTEGLTTALIDGMMSLFQAKFNEYGVAGIIVTHTNSTGSGGEVLAPSAIRGSQSIIQLASSVLGIRRLEDGLTEVYTISPDRFSGRMGRVTFKFDGKFTPLNRKTSLL